MHIRSIDYASILLSTSPKECNWGLIFIKLHSWVRFFFYCRSMLICQIFPFNLTELRNWWINPFKSICSTIWNLFVAEKDVNGILVAFILVGKFNWSIATLKSTIYLSSYPNVGNGRDGVYPYWIPKLYSQDIGMTTSSPVFYLYSFFIYSIVLFCY